MRTRFASSFNVLSSPKAFTSVVRFFLASGRDIAKMTGFLGFWRNLNILCNREIQIGLTHATMTASMQNWVLSELLTRYC